MALQNHLRILLAASVLFAGVPVAWQHSHVGGEHEHSHTHGDHQHQHHKHDDHHHQDAAAVHAHLHVRLFGVETTVPLGSQEDGAEGERTTFFVVAPTVSDVSPAGQFAFLAEPVLSVGGVFRPAPARLCATDGGAVLASSAHLERSCVLLI